MDAAHAHLPGSDPSKRADGLNGAAIALRAKTQKKAHFIGKPEEQGKAGFALRFGHGHAA